MSRSNRRKKNSPALIRRCKDLRSQLRSTVSKHRDEVQCSHRTIEESSVRMIEGLQSRIAELTKAEQEWSEQVSVIDAKRAEIDQQQADLSDSRRQAAEESKQLSEQQRALAEELRKSSDDLSLSLSEVTAEQRKLAKTRKEMDEAKDQFTQREAALANLESELNSRRASLDAEGLRLEEERERLERKSSKTNTQRRLIARQLLARRDELIRDTERCEAEGDEVLVGLRRDLDLAREALESVREENQQLRCDGTDNPKRIAKLEKSLESAKADLKAAQESLGDAKKELREKGKEFAKLERQMSKSESELAKRDGEREAIREAAAEEVEEAEKQVSQIQAELKNRDEQIAEIQFDLEEAKESIELECSERKAAESLLEETQQELEGLRAELIIKNTEGQDEQSFVNQLTDDLTAAKTQIESRDKSLVECKDQLDEVLAKLELTENELKRVCEQNHDTDMSDRDAMFEIRSELDSALDEIKDLKAQNSDLASQVANNQVRDVGTGPAAVMESLSWEERKEYMLRQLNAEDAGVQLTDEQAEQKLQIKDVIDLTNQELARKDEELEELTRLLSEQSTAMGDVAVGGAAIVAMLEQDELIVAEREKLQLIQKEWEEKLRQAEIDVSLERAKLARERIELEQQIAEAREAVASEPEPEAKGRKWLARLGISEDED